MKYPPESEEEEPLSEDEYEEGEDNPASVEPEPVASTSSSAAHLVPEPVASTSSSAAHLEGYGYDLENYTNNQLFKGGEEILKSEHFKIFVNLRAHKRSVKFRVTDLLFDVKIENNDEGSEQPLITSLYEILYKGLMNILKKLKNQFGKELRHLLAITICQSEMINGLNSGYFSINDA